MADLSDVYDKIAEIATGAVYPNGTGQPGIITAPVYVMQGWPKPQDLDLAIASKYVLVSIYDVQGSSGEAPQVFEPLQLISAQTVGLSYSIDDATGQVITLSGAPGGVGEYVSITVNGEHAYTYTSVVGSTAASFASALAALIVPDYPGTTAQGSAITIPGSFELFVRIAAPMLMGKTIHRQTQQMRIVTWATNPADRSKVAAAVDVALKQNLRLIFPDTSQAIMTYQGTYSDDARENEGFFRRDLMFTVLYSTIEQINAYPVTSFEVDSPEPGSEINTLGVQFKS